MKHTASTMATILVIATSYLCGPTHALRSGEPLKLSEPGFVAYPIPLADFVSSEFRPACKKLQEGNLDAGRALLPKARSQELEGYGVQLVILQAAGDELPKILEDSRREAKSHPSAVVQFKVGAAAAILWSENYRSKAHPDNTSKGLRDEAIRNLGLAWQASHNPTVGFFYNNARPYLGLARQGEIDEQILRQCAGVAVFNAYEKAKKNGWKGPLPPVPDVNAGQLVCARWAWNNLISTYAKQRMKLISVPGQGERWVAVGRSPENERAYQYLNAWRENMRRRTATQFP